MVTSLRRQILEGFRAGVPEVAALDGYTIPLASIGSETNKVPQSEESFLSLRMTVFNQRTSGTPDRTYPSRVAWNKRNVIRVECVGAKAWTWLQIFLDNLQEEETIYDIYEPRGLTVTHDGTGIVDISSVLGAREQYRGEAVIEVHCRTVSDRVIVETASFSVDLTTSTIGDSEIQTTIDVDLE